MSATRSFTEKMKGRANTMSFLIEKTSPIQVPSQHKPDSSRWTRHALVVVACILMSVSGKAGDTLFNYRESDAIYLRYLTSVNSFDSASVVYSLGELQLTGSSSSRRIPFDDSILIATEGRLNPNVQGIQTSLLPYARSKTFTIASTEDSLRYYRCLTIANIDTLLRRTSSWRCQDRTEYVLQLVRSSNDSVLATIDSVGLDSTMSISDTLKAFGTSVGAWCRSYNVNTSDKGFSVYLQLVPKRWGATPDGLTLISTQRPFSESVFYNCGSSTPDSARWVALRSKLCEKFLEFAAASWDSECAVPIPPDILLPKSFMETYTDLYYEADTNEVGAILVVPKQCSNSKAVIRRNSSPTQLHNVVLSSNELGFCLSTPNQTSVEVEVFEVSSGRSCFRANVILNNEQRCFTFPSELVNGAYAIRAYFQQVGALRTAIVSIGK